MILAGYQFSGPYFHTRRFVNDFPCVYALINPLGQLVDVGQTDSVNTRIPNHDRKMCWYRHGCTDSGLHLYISHDPNFRTALETVIRSRYNPLCGQS